MGGASIDRRVFEDADPRKALKQLTPSDEDKAHGAVRIDRSRINLHAQSGYAQFTAESCAPALLNAIKAARLREVLGYLAPIKESK